jgi:lysophospholipase L1-like esterase
MGIRGPAGAFKPPTYCHVSRVFDERHLRASGSFCRHKHTLFRWKGKLNSNATLLSDSLAKWVKNVRFTDIQAIPGLNLQRAYEKVKDNTLNVSNYRLILLLVGTNDAVKSQPEVIAQEAEKLINLITEKNPDAKIAFNGLLYRPQDIPEQMAIIRIRKQQKLPDKVATPKLVQPPPVKLTKQQQYDALPEPEKKRRKINKAIQKVCQNKNVKFLEAWKKCEHKKTREVNLDYFADDGLHLNENGINNLKMLVEGNVGRMLPKPKLSPKNKKEKI